MSNRKEAFRIQIRRKHIDQLFAHERRKCLEKAITQQNLLIQQMLASQQKKQQWILQIAQTLKGQPNQNWMNSLRYLSIAAKSYKNHFDLWIDNGIIQILVKMFKQCNLQYNYADLSAIILSDVFYYLPDNSPLVDKILEYQFILDLIEICSTQSQDVQEYYQLIIQMIAHRHYIRDQFISQGLVQHLVMKLKSSIQYESDETFKALSLSYRLIKIYQNNGIKLYPQRNVCSTFIPVLQQYLTQTHRIDIIDVTLKCILSLVQLQSQSIYSLIACSPFILKSVLQYLCLPKQPLIRKICASILSNYLCSKKIEHAKQLMYMGLLDRIYECTLLESQRQQNSKIDNAKDNKSINGTLLLSLQNFAANSLQESSELVKHKVFEEFVIPMTHETQPQKFRHQSIYLIGTLIDTKVFNIIDDLVNKYKIIEIIVLNLNGNITGYELICELLNNLIKLIKFYDNIYTGKVNKIVDILIRFYNIEVILKELEDKCDNKRIIKRIQLLHSKLNGQ